MKVQPARADAFCAKPDPALRLLLLYGPDQGMVRERAQAATRAVLEDPNDPFRMAEIAAKQLRGDPAILNDEAAAMALTGGRRVVCLRDIGNEDAKQIETFLADPPGDALVVIETGDLGSAKASRLVRVVEASTCGAAVACYRDEGAGLPKLIDQVLAAANLSVTADAKAYLTANLGGDRLISRSELEKLVTYMSGPEDGRTREEASGSGPARRTVDLAEASAVVNDTAALSLQDIAYAVAGGQPAALDRALTRSFAEGQSPVAVLRGVARHFQQLHLVSAALAAGRDPESALKQLRPPVFWKVKEAFVAQARGWPPAWLGRALARLLEAEAACKRTGLPDRAICAQALLDLAGKAPLRRRSARH
ncbi:DNA polymerase III subunit delta [Algihabitans albus]|uniref:DNA polymerase III subunit delta n=1 Tax=Algihabitans albus TaxID=2164067 RepID=UPI000E5D9757|nr:DNA polymerase III subunit delta [Algihabitans albus]